MNDALRRHALGTALLERAGLWHQAQARMDRLAGEPSDDAADAARAADDYRMLAHDLARVRDLLPATRTREYLEALYARAHSALHEGAHHAASEVRTFLGEDLPAAVRWLLPYLYWTVPIFLLAAAGGYALVHRYPDLIGLFASPDLIASVERGKLWTDGLLNVVPSSVLSVQILANNITVSLFAYCAGLLFGLGTLYILGLNGLMLGAVFAFVGAHGLAGALGRFVVAHGCVELSVMCLSAAAGAAVGEAVIRPGSAGRMHSFSTAALRSARVLIACAALLVGAGLLEGYVSPNPHIPTAARIGIGVGYWLLMLLLLSGRPFRRRRAFPAPG
ncbi:MAG: stage II sporulation protein M [Proteobacteria bacterium]|nr:stage II sporulation protein M [Pseudomonadota bacterium]